MEFKLAMSLKELKMRTSRVHYKPIKCLELNSREVKKLKKEDFLVLSHLVKCADFLDKISLKLENHHNMEFLKFLDDEIQKGNQKAVLSKRMFLSQKSMFSPDALGNQTVLVKNIKQPEGLGYFPEDLTTKEFCKILSDMLDAGESEEVSKVLSQRTIVLRDGSKLKAVDYISAFDEFKQAAKELQEACKFCSDKKFKNYLELQAKAFLTADPKLDAEADKVWATLDEKTIFEFTVCRECSGETMTASIFEDSKLLEKIKSAGIQIHEKDSIGARVGLVNKNGTKLLKKLKKLIDISAENMPFKEKYERQKNIEKIPQTAVDVDVITLTGEEGAYRSSIVLAQNLPNDDKLSLQLGGGRRNVYHRQVRFGANKKIFKNLITESQFKYFNPEADHWAVICHENTHSLGPVSHGALGKYSSILEEFKADMGIYAFLDEFQKDGIFSEEQAKQIMTTSLSLSFLKGKPELGEAHKVRSVMIVNRLISDGAISFDADGKLVFDYEKTQKSTKAMMREVIKIQLDKNISEAKEYVQKWFVWSKEIEAYAEKLKKVSNKLNCYLVTPLADLMLDKDLDKNLDKILKENGISC